MKTILQGQIIGADKTLSNLDTPQEALYNLGVIPKLNMLVNGEFRDNPNEQEKYSMPSYSIEIETVRGWTLAGGTVNVTNDGITIQKSSTVEYVTLSQEIESVPMGQITLSVIFNGVVFSISGDTNTVQNFGAFQIDLIDGTSTRFELWLNDGKWIARFIIFESSAQSISAAKLESGIHQTLAWQLDDGTWHKIPQIDSNRAINELRSRSYEDGVYTGILWGVGARPRENLLYNAYWADSDNIIDQRDGYIVQSGVTYYAGAGLPTIAGHTAEAMKATLIDSAWGSIIVNGTTYYVPTSDMVQGYVGIGYTLDRWKLGSSGMSIEVADDYISLTSSNTYAWLEQGLEISPALVGQTLTLSTIVRGPAGGAIGIGFATADGTTYSRIRVATTGEWQIASTQIIVPTATTTANFLKCLLYPGFGIDNTGGSADFIAVKCELGTSQTLAHKDADGAWILNDPPPDKALELAKCQRYFLRAYGNCGDVAIANSATTAYIGVHFPAPMRTKPAATSPGLKLWRITNTDVALEEVLSGTNINVPGVQVRVSGTGLEQGAMYTWQATNYIDFSAEL